MQRPATKQSRAANSDEKRFIGWIKDRCICAACGNDAPVIAHHMAGSSAKIVIDFERVLFGHWAVIGLCQCCDNLVTRGSRRALTNAFGPQCEMWLKQAQDYPHEIPEIIYKAIAQWGG